MLIMEEENEKLTLGKTPSSSPKNAIIAAVATTTVADTEVEAVEEGERVQESPASLSSNGIASPNKPVVSAAKEEVIVPSESEALVQPSVSQSVTLDVQPASPTSTTVKPKEDIFKDEAPIIVESSPDIVPQPLEPQDLTVTCTSSFDNYPVNMHKERNTTKSKPNHKVISISVEQCQNSAQVSDEKCAKPKAVKNRKRSHKSTDSDEYDRNKRMRYPEPEMYNDEREHYLSEFIEKLSGGTLDEMQRSTEKLQQEIHSLCALARAKELEWNNLIRIKKFKEEAFLRLNRRKQVMLMMMGSGTTEQDWEGAPEMYYNEEAYSNDCSSKPPLKIPPNLTITKGQSNQSQNLQRFLMQSQNPPDAKNNQSLMMVPIVSSTPLMISSTSNQRHQNLSAPLKIPMPEMTRDKFKMGKHNYLVPILPKPSSNPVPPPNPNEQSPPIGRQGPIVDVKSIIADYRQAHPEQIPRRGRRLKGAPPGHNFNDNLVSSSRNILSMSSIALGSGSQVRTVGSTSGADYSFMMGQQDTSRPSSTDSNRSMSTAQNEGNLTASGVSFKDVLVQFAKMSQNGQQQERRTTPPSTQAKPPMYPEVTLHPVLPNGNSAEQNPSSSLLHGILTKNSQRGNNDNASRQTTFSPTLARLLTTPERPPSVSTSITTTTARAVTQSQTTNSVARPQGSAVSISDILTTSKNRNELTITPVVSNLQPASLKEEVNNTIHIDDDVDEADRLVIDESEEPPREEEELDAENVPQCQGCHSKPAQFVCAGCGNQWYCSRNCQVTSWDDHSDVCTG